MTQPVPTFEYDYETLFPDLNTLFREDGVYVTANNPSTLDDVPATAMYNRLYAGSWPLFALSAQQPQNTWDFGIVPKIPTGINLLVPLTHDPYNQGPNGTVSPDFLSYIEQSVVPSQINYELTTTMSQYMHNFFTGTTADFIPDEIDLTPYLHTVYSQGVMPNSYAHAISHHTDISRAITYQISSLNSGENRPLNQILQRTMTERLSRMHVTYQAQRTGQQVTGILTVDPLVDQQIHGPTLSWQPYFSHMTHGAGMETVYSYPARTQLQTDPPAPDPPDTDRHRGVLNTWYKNVQSTDPYIYHSSDKMTPDQINLSWRAINDTSLGLERSASISGNELVSTSVQHLARGIPLMLHVNVYASWRDRVRANPEDPWIPLPGLQDPIIGSHHMTLAGYFTAATTGEDYFVVVNSFGEQAGHNGIFYLPAEYVKNEQQCGGGANTYSMWSSCWASTQNLDACAPTSEGCNTNQQNVTFSSLWASLFPTWK